MPDCIVAPPQSCWRCSALTDFKIISVELGDDVSIKGIIKTLIQATIWHLHSSEKIQVLLHRIVHVQSTTALTDRGMTSLVFRFGYF